MLNIHHDIGSIIKSIMSSSAEDELGGLFLNTTNIVFIRNILHDMNHPQPPTPIKTDNTTTLGIIANTIRRKCTKSMDIRFHCVSDWVNKKTSCLLGTCSTNFPNLQKDIYVKVKQ